MVGYIYQIIRRHILEDRILTVTVVKTGLPYLLFNAYTTSSDRQEINLWIIFKFRLESWCHISGCYSLACHSEGSGSNLSYYVWFVVDTVAVALGFLRVFLVSLSSIISPTFHTHIYLNSTLNRRTRGRRQRTFKQTNILAIIGKQ
jgi:hypothetical protein